MQRSLFILAAFLVCGGVVSVASAASLSPVMNVDNSGVSNAFWDTWNSWTQWLLTEPSHPDTPHTLDNDQPLWASGQPDPAEKWRAITYRRWITYQPSLIEDTTSPAWTNPLPDLLPVKLLQEQQIPATAASGSPVIALADTLAEEPDWVTSPPPARWEYREYQYTNPMTNLWESSVLGFRSRGRPMQADEQVTTEQGDVRFPAKWISPLALLLALAVVILLGYRMFRQLQLRMKA